MILTTTYFGSVQWYARIARSKEPIFIEAHENFTKQTERNHCRIATANGEQKLTVPVTLRHDGKTPVSEVRISDHGNWRHLHWQAIASAYGMSPFFDYYADDILPFFEEKWELLLDYNMEITQKMFSLLGIEKKILLTDTYQGATEKHQQPEGRHQGTENTCQDTDTNHTDDVCKYYQTFQRRNGFIPGMSILDLLFNEGPQALLILKT